jgi:ribosomal protein S18 acetylase RimI-like enzyme
VTGPFRLEGLTASHDRTGFACGTEALDRYFQTQVTQDARRRVSTCYVAIDEISGRIAGFYTLSAGGVPLSELPQQPLVKKLPRYPSVPVACLGRLAIGQPFQGRKLGAALLADAALRATRSELAVFALVVDAKDDAAAAFYRHHGFEPLATEPRRLILPLGTVKAHA